MTHFISPNVFLYEFFSITKTELLYGNVFLLSTVASSTVIALLTVDLSLVKNGTVPHYH